MSLRDYVKPRDKFELGDGQHFGGFDRGRPKETQRMSDKRQRAARSGEAACSPFQDGQLAFLAGIVVGRNPHDEDSEAHWQWMAGWADQGMKRVKAKMANTTLTGGKNRQKESHE